jgi:hypothetical protein
MKLLYSLGLVSMMAESALAVAVPSPNSLSDDTSPIIPRNLTTDEIEVEARRVSRIPEESKDRPISHSLLGLCWNMH